MVHVKAGVWNVSQLVNDACKTQQGPRLVLYGFTPKRNYIKVHNFGDKNTFQFGSVRISSPLQNFQH